MESMRQYKFRAWYKGEDYPMFEGSLEEDEKPRMIYNIQDIYDGSGAEDSRNGVGHIGCFGSFLDDEDYIVEQYTGLKDKNGVEIYEGDIVQTGWQGNEEGVVVFESSTYCVDSGNGYMYFNHPESYEVIGNIHEHKYLLEE